MEKVVLDTNILIEILKGNEKIVNFIQNLKAKLFISSISKMELFYGARNKSELKKLEDFTNLFHILEINEQISHHATSLIKQYSKSHNLNIPDALIASTCIFYKSALYTLNLKDFRYIDELNLIYNS